MELSDNDRQRIEPTLHQKIEDVFNKVIYLSPPGMPKTERGQLYDSRGVQVTQRVVTGLRELFSSELEAERSDLLAKVSELEGNLRSKSDSYDECWQDYNAERARANHAVEKMNEAKLKVSEQEKEIDGLKEEIANLHLLPAYVVASRAVQKQVSEQSQRIEALTKENERLKEDSNKDLFVIGSQLQELERLREERKELVEALREAEGHLPDDSAGRHISNKIKSLLKEE